MSLNAGYDRDPGGYDRLRGGWLNQRRVQHFRQQLAMTSPGLVVEVGCGTGRMLVDLAREASGTRFVGVEPIADYVAYGRQIVADAGVTNVELHVASGESLTEVVEAGTAEHVISSDVLHHVRSLSEVVRNVRTIAAPRARWSLVEPSAANPYVGLYQALTSGERNFWTGPFLREATRCGWALEERGRMFFIPSCIERPPRWLVGLEGRVERLPVLGGAVTLTLRATHASS